MTIFPVDVYTDNGVHYRILHPPADGKRFELLEDILYFSPRYGKVVHIEAPYRSDGASGAIDIASMGWWVHDKLCEDRAWADGSPCSAWQSSMVLFDIMKSEGYRVRAPVWAFFTYLWQRGHGWK